MRWLVVVLLVPGAAALELDSVSIPEGAEAFDTYGVAFVDLFGDGPVFVGQNDDSGAYLMADGAWTRLATRHPGGTSWHTSTLNGVAVADLDEDGAMDVMVLNTGGYLTRFEADAGGLVERWNRSVYPPDLDPDYWSRHDWETPRPAEENSHIAHGHPAIGPGADGALWTFVVTDDFDGAFAFDADGAVQWQQTWFDAHAGPWMGQLQDADVPTMMVATDGGELLALEASNGGLRWRFDADAEPGSISVPPTVLDVDDDGIKEAFIGARVAVDDGSPDWMSRQHARYYLVDAEGKERWNTSHPQGNPLMHSEAVPFDVGADGGLDLIVLDWNTIGRNPGNFEHLGPGRLFALDGRSGELLWTTDVDAPSTEFMLAGAWRDGPRLFVPHAQNGTPGIAAFDAHDGHLVDWAPLPSGWEATRGVSLVDLDDDGFLEAVVRIHRPGEDCAVEPCREGALAIYSTQAQEAFAWGHTDRSVPPRPAAPVEPSGALGAAVLGALFVAAAGAHRKAR